MIQVINRWNDSDIMRMNDYISSDKKYYLFNIRPSYENHASCPAIAFYNLQTLQSPFYSTTTFPPSDVKIKEPNIEQSFNFSISDDKIENFFEIFNIISKQEVENIYYDGEIQKNIKFSTDIIKSIVITNHTLYDKKYTRYEYNFKGGVIPIIIYIKYLEDTIKYLRLIYGYNKKGEEVNLLKHKIGDIVCLKKDRSVDFLITDYEYGNSGIDYKICEIITDKVSPIIEYGKCIVSNDDDLTYSRDSRIDDILKKD